jgi:SnoaL-like domain
VPAGAKTGQIFVYPTARISPVDLGPHFENLRVNPVNIRPVEGCRQLQHIDPVCHKADTDVGIPVEANGETGSVAQAIEAFTDDGIWEAPNPLGLNKRVEGKEALRPFYETLFSTMKDVTFRICERFATADRVIDDSICTFEVAGD